MDRAVDRSWWFPSSPPTAFLSLSSVLPGTKPLQSQRIVSDFRLSPQRLSEIEQSAHFVIPFRVVRDAVHGDIDLTELEGQIVDTPQFQRLRRVRQLGSSFL